MQKKTPDHASLFFLALAIILGGFVRLYFVLASDFPLNDGGLFYQMTLDLQANFYKLPAITNYNHINLPFAYPPLAFYLFGFLNDLTRISLLDFYRVGPAVISILTIPAFYLLAQTLCKSKAQSALAVLIFALIPTDWLIMGGGATRSLGYLFYMLTLQQVYILYTRTDKKHIISSAVLASLTILSHPEAAVHTAASVFVFFLFFGGNRTGIIRSFCVAGIVIVLTAPWWVLVVTQHGIDPVLSAGQTGWYGFVAAFRLFLFNFTGEIELTIIGVLAAIGLFLQIARNDYLWLFWILAIYISEPRSAPLHITPILVILAAITLETLIFPTLNKFEREHRPDSMVDSDNWAERLLESKSTKIILAFFLFNWIYSAFMAPVNLQKNLVVQEADIESFEWINTHTPIESTFLLITGDHPMTDPVSEWFPALTKRSSITTLQGQEWTDGENFEELIVSVLEVQSCIQQTIRCLQTWQIEKDKQFDYVFIRKPLISGDQTSLRSLPLELSLPDSFQQVYHTDTISIWQRSSP